MPFLLVQFPRTCISLSGCIRYRLWYIFTLQWTHTCTSLACSIFTHVLFTNVLPQSPWWS